MNQMDRDESSEETHKVKVRRVTNMLIPLYHLNYLAQACYSQRLSAIMHIS